MPLLVDSQIFSSKGRFSVEFDKGCSPMTINITEHDAFGVVTRQYYYFEGASITNNKSFTYQESGIYQIVQIVGVDGIGDKTDTLFVEALDPLQPEVEIRKCNSNDIRVTSIDTYYDSIRVYFTPTDSFTLENGMSAEFTYPNSANTSLELKGFFNNADEVCSSYLESITPVNTLQGPDILTASIKESCKDNFTLYLRLNSIDTLVNYRVFLTENTPLLVFDGFLSQPSLILDNIPFGRSDYCLEVEAYDPCNNSGDRGNTFCDEVSELSLSPFESLYSTYDSSGILVNFDSVVTGSFIIYRGLDNSHYELLTERTSPFTDRIGSIGRQYFYKIDYVDSCGTLLYTAETNPPLVETNKIGTNNYEVIFTPPVNSLNNPPENEYRSGNNFSFTEERITSSIFSIQLNPKDGNPRQFVSATSTYPDSLTLSSNAIAVRYELIIHVPKAFTPNGDGLNDRLEFYGLPTETATINIYNRWGQRIFYSEDPLAGWDGTFNGTLADEGTYLYEIIFENAGGNKQMQKGTFALIYK